MDRSITDSIYQFIRTFQSEHGYPPTLREISKACYTSHGNVVRHLDKLEAQGLVSREPGRARSIRLLR